MFLIATFLSLLLAASTFDYPRQRGSNVERLTDVINQLGDRIQIQSSQRKGNQLISPYGISVMLSALYQGASGRTEEQLGRVGYKWLEKQGIDISETQKQLRRSLEENFQKNKLVEANVLLYPSEYSISQQYKEIMQSSYDALVQKMDDDEKTRQVARKVNRWIEEQTDGKISQIADEDELYSSSGLALFNGIYYKGEFDVPSEMKRTKQLLFHNRYEDSFKSVPAIETETRLKYYQDQELKAVQIPLKDGDMKMLVIMPSQQTEIERLQEQLTQQKVKEIVGNSQEIQLKLSLPEFRMESTRQLQQDIKSIGITSPFGSEADFSGVISSRKVRVFQVVQKAVIKVTTDRKFEDEYESWKSIDDKQDEVEFKANRPFLFYIIHKPTGLHLLAGRVTEL